MSKASRIGFLGVEHYHANFWAGALRKRADVELTGIWDFKPARASAFAGAHTLKRWENADELVAACDGIAIASATCDHLDLIRIAARRGKAILCEKPLAASMADCAAIADVIALSDARFMQSFPKRFDPVNHEIKELLAKGAIGQIVSCRVRHGHGHGSDADFRQAWFVDPRKSGGGTLLDEGVHAADFLRFLFGDPQWVTASISSAALSLPVEDTASALFHYDSGLLAEVTTSWCFAAADVSVEIYGTRGTILLSGVDLASRPTREEGFLRIYRSGSGWSASATVPHFKTGVFHEHVALAFADALPTGNMPVTLEDGWKASAMIDAAYRSARSGKKERIAWPDAIAQAANRTTDNRGQAQRTR